METAVLACEATTATAAEAAAAPGAGGGGGAGDVVRLKRSVLAACLTCPLCGRLLRDAATITECLHTFCRKCISEEFIKKEVCRCPICSIDLGCAPLEKLRMDHSLQYVRSKIFPRRQKVEAPEVTSPVTSPIKRKERSLSSLTIHAPQVSMQKCLTKRRKKLHAYITSLCTQSYGAVTSPTPPSWKENLKRRGELFTQREERLNKREADLEERARQLDATQAAQLNQALQAEQRAGVQRIAHWAGEASTALVPLGMSPIQVAEPPASIVDALLVLDFATEQLLLLDQALGARLEAEGRELCRMVADHILTCFRSHAPSISLAPVVEGPVVEAEDAARESVQEVVEIVAARFRRDPVDAEEPDLQGDKGPA